MLMINYIRIDPEKSGRYLKKLITLINVQIAFKNDAITLHTSAIVIDSNVNWLYLAKKKANISRP